MLHSSAEEWTRGNLEGYLDDYAEDATFVGSSGLVEGRSRIRRTYSSGYWASGTPEDGLRFRLLELRMIQEGVALVVGRYELFDRETDAATATGMFSLIVEQRPEGWKIVHDHSSSDPSG